MEKKEVWVGERTGGGIVDWLDDAGKIDRCGQTRTTQIETRGRRSVRQGPCAPQDDSKAR